MSDAHYLVTMEEKERNIRKEEAQNNFVRTVARNISGLGTSYHTYGGFNRYFKQARTDIRRLKSLGFKVTLSRVEYVYRGWYHLEFVVTLP